MLNEFSRGAGLHNAAAHAARKANALAFDIGARFAPNIERLGVITKFNTDFFQNDFGIALDDLQALFVKHFVVRNLARDVRNRLTGACRACRALGFSTARGAPVARGCGRVLRF